MSYYLLDLTTDIDFDNIILGNEIQINENIKKIYIYYLDTKPKEMLVNLPTVRSIFNYKNIKYNQIKLPIYPLWDKSSIFIKFIKKLEKYIQQKIKINKNYSNCLEKKERITTLKINISSKNKLLLTDLKINSEIEGLINIPYIWIKEDNWGLSLYDYELKIIPKIENLNIDFYDEIYNSPKIYKIPLQISFNKESINKDVQNKSSLKISSDILKEAMNKLKKT